MGFSWKIPRIIGPPSPQSATKSQATALSDLAAQNQLGSKVDYNTFLSAVGIAVPVIVTSIGGAATLIGKKQEKAVAEIKVLISDSRTEMLKSQEALKEELTASQKSMKKDLVAKLTSLESKGDSAASKLSEMVVQNIRQETLMQAVQNDLVLLHHGKRKF